MGSIKTLRFATASAAALATALTAGAMAQDTSDGDVLVVTGTRIERLAIEAPSPVTSVGEAEIDRAGTTNLTNLLDEIPALTGSITNSATGFNRLNLRNLGSSRTLVLVNGRRHVGGTSASTSVDVNTIPVDLIERVDVLTGGASAIYGADAVSGAVNFVLKDDFEGFSARIQGGEAFPDADAGRIFGSALYGKNFAGGRGNFTFGVELSSEDGLRAQDRDFAYEDLATLLDNPDFGVNGDNVLQKFYKDATIRFASPEGATAIDLFDGANLLFDFNGAGDVFDPGTVISFRNAIGGDTTKFRDFTGTLTSDIERAVIHSTTRYDFTDRVSGELELKFAQTEAYSLFSPAFGDLIPIDVSDNPFVPQTIFDAANAASADQVYISHDYFELGLRGNDTERKTYRAAGGLDIDVSNNSFQNLTLTIDAVYGRTEEDILDLNNVIVDRLYAAMDAVIDPNTGQPTCRTNLDPSALPPTNQFGGFDAFNDTVTPANFGTTPFFTPGPDSGCLALNMFGLGNNSQEALDWVAPDALGTATVEQTVFTAGLVGDTAGVFEMPGGAGPIGFAFGAEYREESSEDLPPVVNVQGLTFGNVINPTIGEYDVTEVYGELNVPIISGQPFADLLSLDLAGRYSDYSTIGETTTWSVGAIYAPVPEFRVRGTYGVAVRAPNLAELFEPLNQSFFLPDDPCDIDNIPTAADAALRAANCAAILTPLGVDPTTFEGDDILNATFDGLVGGNDALIEETATTFTIGFVAQPSFLDGLTVTADYFNIEIEDGIIYPGDQEIVDQCVDLPTIENQFCDLIERRASDGGLSFLTQQPINVGSFETSGVDFDLNYDFDLSAFDLGNWGDFSARVYGSWLEKLDVQTLPNSPIDDEADETGTILGQSSPEWSIGANLNWMIGNFSTAYRYRYQDSVFRDEKDEIQAAVTNGNVLLAPSRTSQLSTHDIQVSYEFSEQAEAYIGMNNMFDQEPDIGFTGTPVSPVGRFLYAGFRFDTN